MKAKQIYDNYPNYKLDEVRKEMVACEVYETVEEITDDMVYSWMDDENNLNWEDFKEELTTFIDKQKHSMLLVGYVGTWRGRMSGGINVNKFDDLYKFWKDCDYIKVYEVRGRLFIEASHHDGTNKAELRCLTDKGQSYRERHDYDFTDEEMHAKLMNNSKYSKAANFIKTMWG